MKLTGARFDVIVAGAGLVGTAAACLFARQGFSVALVEARAIDDDHDETHDARRVSAIGVAGANLLGAIEVWSQIDAAAICEYREMRVWEHKRAARIHFSADEIGMPCLGHIVDNRAMVAAMMEKLRHNYFVKIMPQTEIDSIARNEASGLGGGLTVGLRAADGERDAQLETDLLVGADGGNSRVRELCGIECDFSDFAQDAITATVSINGDHRATAWQCFLETGPAALLPLANGRCSLVWSCAIELADELTAMDEAAFCARLQELFGDALGEITACRGRRRFPLVQQHAESYIADCAALVGDAAHATHPLAGLGANLGLVDVAALAEVVGDARQRGLGIGQHSVLRRYERWRKGDNGLVLAVMAGFNDLFGASNSGVRALRRVGMNLTDSLNPLKTGLAKFAAGVYGDMPAVCRGV